ncbi:MAG: MaoC/PaaZ C-terminal domain-containing protein [Dehalococcoidia bacterium]
MSDMIDKVYFEDVNEGDEVPPFSVSPVTRTIIVKYAGAGGDFSPMHHDELHAIRTGADRIFAHGLLGAGFMGTTLEKWLGVGHLRRLRTRFGERLWANDSITCKGVVTKKYVQDGEHLIDIDAWIENQWGQRTHTIWATAALPTRS